MTKCTFCGKNNKESHEILVGSSFYVCCESCKQNTEEYFEMDKKHKIKLYIFVFIASVSIIVSVFTSRMVFAYAAQLIFGGALIIFPYPVINSATLTTHSIKTVKLFCRLLGVFFIIWSIILLFSINI